ncbi:MAG TPA: TonB-dependent receptor [Flavipsychrobacter sp.]|nr:TonB-dependent receptor [Flavipsychrobacter sp.]
MKKIVFLILSILLTSYLRAQTLSGKITDSITHEPISGAIVYIPELKLGTTTDDNGNFKISHIPKGSYEMEVKILGYATFTKQVTIRDNAICNCPMCPSSYSTNEVVITALGNVTNTQRSPMPVTLVSHQAMLEKTSSTVIDAIANQPGVNETMEGPGTTKPQINGLGFDRVLVLTDGERQEDFQWGDDHGILIDPYAIYDAEIIRGPASLQYGASAEAGVINFKSEPFAESGTVQGSALTEYQTNNGLIANSVGVGGNNNGFVWNLRASSEEAHSYWNPKDGYVWGSAWQQQNARLTIGLNKSWGYTRLSVSALHRRIEVPDGNRDSTGRFMFDAPENGQLYPTRADFLSYNADIASDKILNEYQVWWQNSFNVGLGRIGLDIGFTRSEHHDIDTGTIGQGNMVVNDIPYSLKYQITGENSTLKFTTGVNGTYEFENNYPEPPAPYIGNFEIPDYTDFQAGIYAIIEKDFKNLTISGGARYDWNNFIGQSMYLLNSGTPEQQQVPEGTPGAMQQFAGFNNTYTGPSGSIGASYQLPANNYVKLNLSKSFRAPAINELTSNGLNIGTKQFQLGNISLKAEEGYEVDFAYGNNGKDVSFEADGFYNYINNFIFADRTDSSLSGFPVYPTKANTAIITGVSGYFSIHPASTKWLEINNGFTYIYSFLPHQTDSTNHVPYTPAPHLTTEVKIKLKDRRNSILMGTYFKFGQSKYWAQNNIYSALYTELPSKEYSLYNVGVGTNFINPKTGRVICSFYANCTNLLNLAYVDHLNLAQYFLSYNGQVATVTNQSQGIYNMGRNVSFKLVFPIGGHKVSETEAQGAE